MWSVTLGTTTVRNSLSRWLCRSPCAVPVPFRMPGPPLQSLVKYDTPSLLTTRDKKSTRAQATSTSSTAPLPAASVPLLSLQSRKVFPPHPSRNTKMCRVQFASRRPAACSSSAMHILRHNLTGASSAKTDWRCDVRRVICNGRHGANVMARVGSTRNR